MLRLHKITNTLIPIDQYLCTHQVIAQASKKSKILFSISEE